MSMIDKIMAYESGELDEDEIIGLFQELVNNGVVWGLQGSYGRQAQQMIEAGLIVDPKAKKYFVHRNESDFNDSGEPFEADSLLEAHKMVMEPTGYEVVETDENGRKIEESDNIPVEACFLCGKAVTNKEKRIAWRGVVFCSDICQHTAEFKTW